MFTYTQDVVTYLGAALNCKRGATAIEYGLIAAGIAVAIMGGITLIGGDLTALFNRIGGKLATQAVN